MFRNHLGLYSTAFKIAEINLHSYICKQRDPCLYELDITWISIGIETHMNFSTVVPPTVTKQKQLILILINTVGIGSILSWISISMFT